MIDEVLSDGERRFLLRLLMHQVQRRAAPNPQVLRLISQLSGVDTVVVCRRGLPSFRRRPVVDETAYGKN
jgi:hypothetical protein